MFLGIRVNFAYPASITIEDGAGVDQTRPGIPVRRHTRLKHLLPIADQQTSRWGFLTRSVWAGASIVAAPDSTAAILAHSNLQTDGTPRTAPEPELLVGGFDSPEGPAFDFAARHRLAVWTTMVSAIWS